MVAFALRYLIYYYNVMRTEQRPEYLIKYFKFKERYEFELDEKGETFDKEEWNKYVRENSEFTEEELEKADQAENIWYGFISTWVVNEGGGDELNYKKKYQQQLIQQEKDLELLKQK